MTEIAIRPRFKLVSTLSCEEIIENLRSELAKHHNSINGIIINQHIILRIPIDEQHYWSPQLDVELEATKKGTSIKGLFGPRPSVWFGYVFFYSVLGFISMIVMIMGFSQLNLGLSARILWVLPITSTLFLFAFFTAKTGQRLGKDEMHRLHQFLVHTIT